MSLLDRFNSIRKKIRPGFILLIPVFLGCETSEDIGIRYELESGANTNFIELTLPASNIIVDSLRTDGENTAMIGEYNDNLIGSTRAESYFTLRVRSSNIPSNVMDSTYTYDSIRMYFQATSSVSSQDVFTQSFDLHLLEDTLANLIYLASKKETLGTRVGNFSTTQLSSDTLPVSGNFLLDQSFGQEVFDNFEFDRSVISETNWPSMAMVPTSESNVLSEISLTDDTTGLYLYVTHPDGLEKIDGGDTTLLDTTYVIEFAFFASSNVAGYVNLERDKTGSQLEGRTDNTVFDLADGSAIIDPVGGVSTLFSIEPLTGFFEQLREEERTIIINNATLAFRLEDETSRDRLQSFYSYTYRNNDFFAPGLVTNTFSSLIIDDRNNPAVSEVSNDSSELLISASLFFQSLYNSYQAEGKILLPDLNDDSSIEFNEFVLISQEDLTLDRSIIANGGATLRIYYIETD